MHFPEMTDIDQMALKLASKSYGGSVKPINSRQKVTDEDLDAIFTAIEDKYFELTVLKNELEGLIKVNDSDRSRSAVSSTYLYRLSRHTKKRWRQKKAVGDDGRLLVKFYTDGAFRMRKAKKKTDE